ncbi:hypothetical protein C8J57DRAFT_1357353 [Mycena rebaudengoi]|nr:hypothetical protein C8J57DRAFT_1357353 [Mycena rebaudengoi]
MTTPTPTLFQPITLGPQLPLKHRIVLAPLTRYRGTNPKHVPILPMMKEYYTQRASAPGTFLITEATFIAERGGGEENVPGIWSEEQVAAWKEISDSVHAVGCFIFLQMYSQGRAAHPAELRGDDPSLPYVSASDVKLKDVDESPRPLTIPEIHEYVALYEQAAKNAMRAGFDGVEIHSANGYLPNQFLDEGSNLRTDEYGGSVENRTRFVLEIVDVITKAITPERTAIRFSPWSTFNDMNSTPADPLPTYEYLVAQLKTRYPELAYIHVVEPRIKGDVDQPNHEYAAVAASTASKSASTPAELGNALEALSLNEPASSPKPTHTAPSNDSLRALWAPKLFISAGGYTRETALVAAERGNELVAFGRRFLANPDLILRLKTEIPQNKYNRATFYLKGNARGYTDYPFASAADAGERPAEGTVVA